MEGGGRKEVLGTCRPSGVEGGPRDVQTLGRCKEADTAGCVNAVSLMSTVNEDKLLGEEHAVLLGVASLAPRPHAFQPRMAGH